MLVIAGLGIKLASHITHEVKLAITDAQKVFYISFNTLMDEYIKKLNPNSESLNYLYDEMPNRLATYIAMKDKVVAAVIQDKQKVCFVFYGHPCIFAMSGRLATQELRAQGHTVAILPGISALDCIFADLLIDSNIGYACFEATELVMHQRIIDTSMYIILWQPAMFDNFSTIESCSNAQKQISLQKLVAYLLKFHQKDHMVTIYCAAMYPGQSFSATEVALSQLNWSMLSLECTLIIPPAASC